MDFYKPSYLQDDYDSILDILGQTCTLNASSATPTTDFLCMIGDSSFTTNSNDLNDNTSLIKFSLSHSEVKKGDYLTDEDGNIYIIYWSPFKEINCYTSQIQLCTTTFTFEKFYKSVIDYNGTIATPNQYISIATDIKGYISRTGANSYKGYDGDIGIVNNQKLTIVIPFNEYTSQINISDEFSFYNNQHIIVDIDFTQVINDSGILILYAERLEGGRK